MIQQLLPESTRQMHIIWLYGEGALIVAVPDQGSKDQGWLVFRYYIGTIAIGWRMEEELANEEEVDWFDGRSPPTHILIPTLMYA